MKHFVVVNPQALAQRHSLKRVIAHIKKVFTPFNTDYEIYISRYPRDAAGVLRERLRSSGGEKTRVYALGGDGTLFDCLNGIAGSDIELTAVPYGAANSFVRGFGEQFFSCFRDIALLASSRSLVLDLFSCNANHALNYCAIGIEGAVALTTRTIAAAVRRFVPVIPADSPLFRRLGLCAALLRAPLREQYYTISIDGADYSGRYAGIMIANGGAFGHAGITSPRALPWDGSLNVLLIKSAAFISLALHWSAWRRRSAAFCAEVLAKNINIRSTLPLEVCCDGEAFLETELAIQIIPSSLRFVIPEKVLREQRSML